MSPERHPDSLLRGLYCEYSTPLLSGHVQSDSFCMAYIGFQLQWHTGFQGRLDGQELSSSTVTFKKPIHAQALCTLDLTLCWPHSEVLNFLIRDSYHHVALEPANDIASLEFHRV